MGTEQRQLVRIDQRSIKSPLTFTVVGPGLRFSVTPINYHFRGACINIAEEEKRRVWREHSPDDLSLEIRMGARVLQSRVLFRVCWNDIERSGNVGLEFTQDGRTMQPRSSRMESHSLVAPTGSCQDPLDPNRQVVFRVGNLSERGMQITTSLANRHILPGMTLYDAEVTVPGQGSYKTELQVANARVSEDGQHLVLGVAIDRMGDAFAKGVRQYVVNYGRASRGDAASDDRIASMVTGGWWTKHLRRQLTYRAIVTEEEYQAVLKLRFAGYGAAGKVPKGASWRDQGSGLEHEGIVIGAYLGSQLVASMEMRFGNSGIPLRSDTMLPPGTLAHLDRDQICELNKLVVHPKVRGSDLVLGMFQFSHSQVAMRGRYLALLLATDKLKPMYTRVGFEAAGPRVPHPSLAGEFLTPLILRPEVYSDGRMLDPLSWNAVYAATTEVLREAGLAQTPGALGRWIRFLMDLPRLALRRLRQRDNPQERLRPQTVADVDVRWTDQHYLSSVVFPYIVAADSLIGSAKVDDILHSMRMTRAYFRRHTSWLSVAFLDAFIDNISRFASPETFSELAGKASFDKRVLGLQYYFIKHFVSPRLAFRTLGRLLSKFNLTRTYVTERLESGHAILKVGAPRPELLPKHRSSCLNWISVFRWYVHLLTGEEGVVTKKACCYDGDDACVYDVQWRERSKVPLILAKAWAVILAFAGLAWATADRWQALGLGALGATVGSAVIVGMVMAVVTCIRLILEKRDLSEKFDRYSAEARDAYAVLQEAKVKLEQRYQEAQLLEGTAHKMQESDDVSGILKATIDSVCTKFEFGRAIIMLADETRQRLKTAAIAGVAAEDSEDIWRFQVDITRFRPDRPTVVSSVFHTGQSVIIDDVAQHMFQLTEESQMLIRKLGIRGFVMVPIPSRDSRWGVLLADCAGRNRTLGRSDVVLLQRVARQLGLVLDRQAKLDAEVRLRSLFERYVPQVVLAQADATRALPTLGGQLRQVASLVVDVRDFTRLSSILPPQAVLDALGIVFDAVGRTVKQSGGVIDKFLGDGVLATWDLEAQGVLLQRIVAGLLDFCDRIPDMQEELARKSLPRLQIGMGLTSGPAVVGNVGTAERMEFTAIGLTVNMASRLEGLCKVLGTQLVVSQDVYDRMDEWMRVRFKLSSPISIRGLDGMQRVACLAGGREQSKVQVA